MTDASGPQAKPPQIREAARRLATGRDTNSSQLRQGATSELTIDETLVLHSVGWEPVDLVWGVSTYSIPAGVWQWGSGEIAPASIAHQRAVDGAATDLRYECQQAGGHGVVGVHIEVAVERHFVNAVMAGTAVAPSGAGSPSGQPFLSDLSGRELALLLGAGWAPLGLAYGASIMYAPRRGATAALRQSGQNVELTNYTEALYRARESAMERMQVSAQALEASGVVGVQVSEGPMEFARHAIRFTAWGTAVRPSGRGGSYPRPQVVVPLDDARLDFDAAALRGG